MARKKVKQKPFGTPAEGNELSADCLILIQNCLDTISEQATKLHWQILPFFPPSDYHKGANAIEILKNIASYQNRIQIARNQVTKAFTAQFEKKTK